MPKLIMLSGPSGSGKSTVAKEMMATDGNLVRLNRDSIRAMSIVKWTPKREGWIIDAEVAMARAAAKSNRNVLIDDTNLTPKDEARWKGIADEIGYSFIKHPVMADLATCISRDKFRVGSAHIGRPAIERQFLRAKLWKVPEGKKTVIFDIDGTLADLQHRVPWITIGAACPAGCDKGQFKETMIDVDHSTSPATPIYQYRDCPYCVNGVLQKKHHDVFYSLVDRDEPIHAVIAWIKACAEEFYVLIVSGRSPETSGEGTVNWLATHDIPYEHLIMRRAFMHGPDTEEKQLILNDILQIIPKEDIAFVVDDRPSVVQMWRDNGLRVFPVRGRDDDAFYEIMNTLEATHPKAELEAQNEGKP